MNLRARCCGALMALVSAVLLRAADTQFLFDPNGNQSATAPAVAAPPEIKSDPRPQLVAPGAVASFLVVAENTLALTYQWLLNGTNIAGATNDALVITNVAAADQGLYTVVLANSSGSVTSAPAALMLDGDSDGLADSWELAYFSNLNQTASGDSDRDGVSNAIEFQDGTNPTNKASAFFRLTILRDGGVVEATPAKAIYTNGEVVNVTATPVGDEKFHGWTGDVVSTNHTLSLTLTSNRLLVANFSYYTLVWTNTANADWHNALNWSPNLVPAMGDHVIITAGTATANSSAECGSLTLGAPGGVPSVAGSGALTIHSNGIWISGSMMGPGRTIIGTNATFAISNAATVNINGRTLDNAGTLIRLTSGTITLWANSLLTNRPGASIEAHVPCVFNTYIGPGRIDNAGTIRKLDGGGTLHFAGDFNGACPLNNYGDIEVQTGTLLIEGGGVHTGTMTFGPGTTLQLARSDFTATGGSSITGPGSFVASGGNITLGGNMNLAGAHTFSGANINLSGNFICTNNAVTISSGSANFNGTGVVEPNTVSLTGGIFGGAGLVTVREQLSWTGGSMSGGGRTVIAPTATFVLSSAANQVLGRTLDNAGTALWIGTGGLFLGNVAITNRPGALFEARTAAALMALSSTVNRFDNAGTFRKIESGGQFGVDNFVAFNNDGTVEIQAGSLRLGGGGSSSGIINLAPGTTLIHAGNTFHWNGSGTLAGTGDFVLSGGAVNFNGNFVSTNNTATFSGATASFVGTGTLANVVFNGGTIAGGGLLQVQKEMAWLSGGMAGAGRTFIGPEATLTINHSANQNLGRMLDNGGTILWVGPGNLFMGNAVITNRPGALFEARNNAAFFLSGSTVNRFDNAGLFRKVNSAGQTVFDNNGVGFNNYGEVDLQTGALWIGSGGLNTSNITLAADTTLELRRDYTATAGSRISGAGQLVVSSGNVTLNGLVNVSGPHLFSGGTANINGAYTASNNTVTISGGTANFNTIGTVSPAVVNLVNGTLGGSGTVTVLTQMTWTAGAMVGNGRTITAPGATFTMSNPGNVSLSRTIENRGTTLWTAAGGIFMANAVFTNAPGGLFDAQNAAALIYQTGVNRFDNAGTFRKSLNSGTTTVPGNIAFNNYGAIEIETGILAAGGYTCTSGSSLHCYIAGTAAGTSYGRLQSATAVNLSGALRVSFTNGFLPAVNDSFTVFTANSRAGTFSSFQYPSEVVGMELTNTANAVTVRVTEIRLTNGPPVIFADIPAAQVFYAGRLMTQAVAVAGAQPFGFQWQRNGVDLADDDRVFGAQSRTLSISNAAVADSGEYRLIVTNAEGSSLSRASQILVQAVPKLNAAGAGWSLQGTTVPVMNSSNVTLTAGLGSTARAVFYQAPLHIRQFLAQFVYVDVGGNGADGITFCLHNDPRGAAALGGGGGGLGYAGISPSAAVALNIYQPNTRGMSFRTNGTLPPFGGFNPTPPVNVASGNPIGVSLLYTGGVLRVTLAESNTANVFTTNLIVNLPALVGAETAYVGLTGGDGGVASTQVVSNFVFVPITSVIAERSGNAVVLSWPELIGGYQVLESATISAADWQVVTNRPTQSGGRNRVTIPAQSATRFYELRINPSE